MFLLIYLTISKLFDWPERKQGLLLVCRNQINKSNFCITVSLDTANRFYEILLSRHFQIETKLVFHCEKQNFNTKISSIFNTNWITFGVNFVRTRMSTLFEFPWNHCRRVSDLHKRDVSTSIFNGKNKNFFKKFLPSSTKWIVNEAIRNKF